jgi:hypothetical protein
LNLIIHLLRIWLTCDMHLTFFWFMVILLTPWCFTSNFFPRLISSLVIFSRYLSPPSYLSLLPKFCHFGSFPFFIPKWYPTLYYSKCLDNPFHLTWSSLNSYEELNGATIYRLKLTFSDWRSKHPNQA